MRYTFIVWIALIFSTQATAQSTKNIWKVQTLDGLTIETPHALERQDMRVSDGVAKLLSRLNMYRALDDDLIVIYNFIEFKQELHYDLEKGLRGAVANSILTMNGTDIKLKTHKVRKDKLALKGSGDFVKDDERVYFETFGHWNKEKQVIMVIAFAFTKKGRSMAPHVIASAKVKGGPRPFPKKKLT